MALLYHAGDDCLGDDVGSDEVDVDDLAEVLCLHLKHGNTLDDAGVVDKDVDGAEVALDVCDHLDDVFFISNVAVVALGVDALLGIGLHGLFHVLLAAAVKSDLCAAVCVSLGYRKANAICCARNKSDFAFE